MARRFFSLRVQALLFFFMVQLALFVAVFGVTGAWLMRGFVALETTQTNETLRQALRAVDNEVQELNHRHGGTGRHGMISPPLCTPATRGSFSETSPPKPCTR